MYGGPDRTGWPAEPTTVEITEIELESVSDDAGKHLASDEPRRSEIEARFRAAVEGDSVFRNDVEYRLCEVAGKRDGDE